MACRAARFSDVMNSIRTAGMVMLSCFWLAGFAGSSAAHAQQAPAAPPLSASLTGAAKSEYDSARLLFGDGDYAGALVKFERALELSGDVRLLWNMAVCEKNLRHYVKVLRLLERYRLEAGERLTASQLTEVSSVLQTVKTLISEVRIQCDQSGAEVYVDDVLQGTTPLSAPLLVDLGARKLRISKPGWKDWQTTREFAGQSTVLLAVTLQSEPKDGQLTIFVGDDAIIRIDGRSVGRGYFQGMLRAGEHHVEITAEGKLPFARELVLKVGEARTLHVSLQSLPGSVSPWVWVGAGVLAAGGLALGGYLLMRPPPEPQPTPGTLPPYVVTIPR